MGRKRAMMERIRKEARSHQDDCGCTTCRAAAGDEDAKNQLMGELL